MAVTHGHGNPKWTRDEIVLALDLYFSCKGSIPRSDDARVQELSRLLRSLPYFSVAARKATFRNPAGVAFKLQNIRQVASAKGLDHVSGTDRRIWMEFGRHPEKVHRLAVLIRRGIEALGQADEDPDEEEFAEGRLMTALHKRRERNRKVRARLLAARERNGRLSCDMCDCVSNAVASNMEDATFEAHHRVLLSDAEERSTRLSDMALLCANCHRLLHRAISVAKRWIDVDEGRTLVHVDNSSRRP